MKPGSESEIQEQVRVSRPVLVFGYGNPGRRDDGLGCRLVQILEEKFPDTEDLHFDCNYQLNIEEGELISGYKTVFFADASVAPEAQDILIEKVEPSAVNSFSTHSVSPSYILHLSQNLFQSNPDVYLLHIKGYEWNFEEGLTSEAEKNLRKAAELMESLLSGG